MSTPTAKKAHVWERDALDWYVEPEQATTALLGAERFVGSVLDPCCGGGNIVRACMGVHLHVRGADITDRVTVSGVVPPWWLGTQDFLARTMPVPFDNIIMNPPFFRAKGTEAFIRQALRLCRGKVAAFVDVRFLAGAERANGLFREHCPDRIWIITPRVSCPPGEYLMAGGKAGNGSSDWAWVVWSENRAVTSTTLSWLRRSA